MNEYKFKHGDIVFVKSNISFIDDTVIIKSGEFLKIITYYHSGSDKKLVVFKRRKTGSVLFMPEDVLIENTITKDSI